jgi:SAM-dependent methyltransferase
MNYGEYRQAIVEWYRSRIDPAKDNVTVLSSGNNERREIRFDVLRAVGMEDGCSVLDVGCGFADFYDYLLRRGVKVRYVGVDIVPEFVEQARARFPEIDVSLRDVLEAPLEAGSFDFVVCSQVLNLRFPDSDNMAVAKRFLSEMHRMARRGVACDFVTDYVDFKEPYLHYYKPEEMFAFAKTLSKRVVLRHDYPLFEFCLYIYPDFEGRVTRRR